MEKNSITTPIVIILFFTGSILVFVLYVFLHKPEKVSSYKLSFLNQFFYLFNFIIFNLILFAVLGFIIFSFFSISPNFQLSPIIAIVLFSLVLVGINGYVILNYLIFYENEKGREIMYDRINKMITIYEAGKKYSILPTDVDKIIIYKPDKTQSRKGRLINFEAFEILKKDGESIKITNLILDIVFIHEFTDEIPIETIYGKIMTLKFK